MSADASPASSAAARATLADALSDARLAALLDERTSLLARRPAEAGPARPTQSFLLCACRGERIGLPLHHVGAVVAMRACTPLPGAPQALRGLVALAGVAVTVIDLAEALGLPPREGPARGGSGGEHLVRVRAHAVPVALVVERALGIAHVDPARIDDGHGTPDQRAGVGVEAGREAGLGPDGISGYAPPGAAGAGPVADGFAILDLPRLLGRFTP